MSDGLSVLSENPLIGTVIDTKEDLFSLEPSYSTSIALSSENIVDQILTQLSVRRDPLLIATLGGEIFPIDRMVQLDMIWQEIDLSLRNL